MVWTIKSNNIYWNHYNSVHNSISRQYDHRNGWENETPREKPLQGAVDTKVNIGGDYKFPNKTKICIK
jgi:hypothetical protein